MEMEEKHNPNSHERLKSWSDLPLDLLNSVFESLSFANFQRARSVCSSWNSASRQCVPKQNQIHWLILFPKDNNNNNNDYSCRFFNPEEKDKLYKTQDLGLEFARSVCVATYGSWLLMRSPLYNLYIVNLFTQERINLPPTESQLGQTRMKRIENDVFRVTCLNARDSLSIRSPVFWIDEKTKDHMVFWRVGSFCVVSFKKGDTSWYQIPETSECCDVVYKDHKLYLLCGFHRFKIFDCSGEIPKQTFHCDVMMERLMFCRKPSNSWKFRLHATRLVVTVTGDVLMVEQCFTFLSRKWIFQVFKIFSPGFLKRPQLNNSLGHESMLLDQGITVLADDIDGFIRNSIYFSTIHEDNTDCAFLYNLETGETEPLHKFDSSSVQISSAQWFLPSFTQT